jgi:K+-transporting ATPase KdpF subunit
MAARPKARILGHGYHSTWSGCFVLRDFVRLRRFLRQRLTVRERYMLFEYILGGLVTVFLLTYLTYALVRPERF